MASRVLVVMVLVAAEVKREVELVLLNCGGNATRAELRCL